MKTMKYLFIGALMLGLSSPVVAQDNKAAIEQAAQIIKSNSPEKAKELKSFAKKFKKNGEVLIGIGRTFLELKDTASAREYAEQGMKLSYGPAYELLGDLAALSDDGGQAALMYEQAIYFDKSNPEPYLKYATMHSKIAPNGALSKLEELRVAVPDYPVDLPMAKLYQNTGKLDKAIESYDKWYTTTGFDKKEPGDLASYALIYYLKKDYAKSLSIVKESAQKYPRSSSLNRVALMNTIAMQDYDQALTWGDRLFNQSDSSNFNDFDYTNYAQAYVGKAQYDEAIALYRKGMEVSKADKDAVNNLRKEISDAYMKKGEFDNAMAEYRSYLDNTTKKTAEDYRVMAEMYYKHAADLTGDEQQAAIKSADDVYAQAQQLFANNPDVLSFILNRRGTLNAILDPDSKLALAKPIFEQQIELMEAKQNRNNTETNRLVTAYRYLMSYALLVQDDKEGAREWAQKILNVDPENEQAKQVIENIK